MINMIISKIRVFLFALIGLAIIFLVFSNYILKTQNENLTNKLAALSFRIEVQNNAIAKLKQDTEMYERLRPKIVKALENKYNVIKIYDTSKSDELNEIKNAVDLFFSK